MGVSLRSVNLSLPIVEQFMSSKTSLQSWVSNYSSTGQYKDKSEGQYIQTFACSLENLKHTNIRLTDNPSHIGRTIHYHDHKIIEITKKLAAFAK